MYCKKCGAEIKDDSKFCKKCGTEIQKDVLSQQISFYIVDNGDNKGPYNLNEMRNLFQAGILHEDTIIWNEGMESGCHADQIEAINNIFLQGKIVKCELCGKEYFEKDGGCPNCKAEAERKCRKEKIKKRILILVPSVLVVITLMLGMVYYFKNVYLNPEEKAAVNETITAINEIGSIDKESEEKILYAEGLYAELLPKSMRRVANKDTLVAARKEYNELMAQSVIDKIAGIGEITSDSGSVLEQINNEYEALSDNQKRLVENWNLLNEYFEQYNRLCAQEVEKEIDGIGPVTLDKTIRIREIREKYDSLTSEQKEMVANKEVLDEAYETITKAYADMETAKDLVEKLMDGFQYSCSGSEIISLVGNSKVFDAGVTEMLSRGFVSDMIINTLSGDIISYGNLNYLSRSTMDLLEDRIEEAFVVRYTMKEPSFSGNDIVVEVSVDSAFGSITEKLMLEMVSDMKKYADSNKTTLSYMKKYYSEKELYAYILDAVILSYSTSWLRQMDTWELAGEKKSMTWRIKLSEYDGEWKIVSIIIIT